MSRLVTSRKLYDLVICIALLCAIASLMIFPKESVQAAKDGLTLCMNVIIPSLFPFFVLSTLTVGLGLTQYFGRLLEPIMRPLFNLSGACSSAVVLGFVGGYPVGAKTAISLYESGAITKSEAERLLAFCNNSGPAFVLGVVGVGIFASSRVGLLLYATHAAASIIVGILFRGWGEKSSGGNKKVLGKSFQAVRFTQVFPDSVTSAFQSTLNICGFVIFFTVFIKMLVLSGVIPAVAALLGKVFSGFGLDAQWAEKLLTGFIEISSGVWSLKELAGKLSSTIAMAAFMLGWAGLSVHCQVLSFIGGSGLSVRSYILGKLLHGAISSALIFLLTKLVPFEAPVASYLAEGLTGIASMDFTGSIVLSTLTAGAVWLLFILICLIGAKRTGKRHRNTL